MLIVQDGILGQRVCTPAHRYVYQGDFGKILEDIERGEIPEDDISGMNQGWGNSSGTTYNGGNVINGFTFGSMT